MYNIEDTFVLPQHFYQWLNYVYLQLQHLIRFDIVVRTYFHRPTEI